MANATFFLQQPTELSELNEWIVQYLATEKYFTFSEETVVSQIWQNGQDIRLREDSRFKPVKFNALTHWRLNDQKVVNHQLYERMLDGEWDGQSLLEILSTMKTAAKNKFRPVFCPLDPRFKLTETGQFDYSLSLTEHQNNFEITQEHVQLFSSLVANLPSQALIWRTSQLLKELAQTYAHEDIDVSLIENWLLQQADWQRIGLDLWLRGEAAPCLSSKVTRYAVLPVVNSGLPDWQPAPIVELDIPVEKTPSESFAIDVEYKEENLPSQLKWQITLRTFHINEGVIHVPTQARIFYPHAYKLADTIALAGLWYEDGSEILLWLDRKRHKLFGPHLQDKLAWLETGDIIQLIWTHNNLIFTLIGNDATVASEESRLVDFSQLSDISLARLESYRVTLHQILVENNVQPFINLYEQLCIRQKHIVSKNTVRTILSTSPEFEYIQISRSWSLKLNLDERVSAKGFRQVMVSGRQISQASERTTSYTLSQLLDQHLDELTAFNATLINQCSR